MIGRVTLSAVATTCAIFLLSSNAVAQGRIAPNALPPPEANARLNRGEGYVSYDRYSQIVGIDLQGYLVIPLRERPNRGKTLTFMPFSLDILNDFVVSVDYTNYDGGSTASFMGGVRLLILDDARFRVLAQVQAGILRDAGANDFALAPGGLIDIPLEGKAFHLVGVIDFPIDFYTGGHTTGTRLSFGVSLPLSF